jgi:uncharacterized membrane protein
MLAWAGTAWFRDVPELTAGLFRIEKWMPFCSQCGNQVGGVDAFCGKCGAPQPIPSTGPRPSVARSLETVNPKTASILCYIPWVGWIPAIVVLASDRFRADRAVRFHAFQGLYLFVAWLIADQVIRPVLRQIPRFHVYGIIEACLIGAAVFMMVKAAHQQTYPLPLFGELAQRSVAED